MTIFLISALVAVAAIFALMKFGKIEDKDGNNIPDVVDTKIKQTKEVAKAAKEAAKSSIALVSQLQQAAVPAVGGIASAATNQQPSTPVAESLNRTQLNELFGITGNKVDASKLEKAWTKAGSPTDSEEVAKILQDAGVDPAVIAQAFTEMGLPEPSGGTPATGGTTSVNTQDLLAQIMALTPAEQQQVLAYLQK
jgi:hypothetical protein